MAVVKPKYTMKQLDEMYTGYDIGDRKLFEGVPAIMTNAEYVSANPGAIDKEGNSCHGADPYFFDPKGHQTNKKLKKALLAVFKKHKKKPNDKISPFLLTWRHYPNADHPRWQNKQQACGC